MTALGVLPEVAERCLNHTEENKVKRIYQRHNYRTEMTNAWKVLGQHLQDLTSGELPLSKMPQYQSFGSTDGDDTEVETLRYGLFGGTTLNSTQASDSR